MFKKQRVSLLRAAALVAVLLLNQRVVQAARTAALRHTKREQEQQGQEHVRHLVDSTDTSHQVEPDPADTSHQVEPDPADTSQHHAEPEQAASGPCRIAIGVAENNPGCTHGIITEIMNFIKYPYETECQINTEDLVTENPLIGETGGIRHLRGEGDGRELNNPCNTWYWLCYIKNNQVGCTLYLGYCNGRRELSSSSSSSSSVGANDGTEGVSLVQETNQDSSRALVSSNVFGEPDVTIPQEDFFGPGWQPCGGDFFSDYVHDVEGFLRVYDSNPAVARCFGFMWCQVKNRPIAETTH